MNWCFNEITVSKKVYEAIAITDKYMSGEEFESISFNKLIPEPETKEECIEKYGENYINEKDNEGSFKPWFDWSNWRGQYWGTMCDAADVEVCINENSGDIGVSFNSAWCPPETFFIELCKRFPDEKIEGYVEEEQNQFNPFRWENDNGSYIITEELEPEWYDDDYDDEDDDYDDEDDDHDDEDDDYDEDDDE